MQDKVFWKHLEVNPFFSKNSKTFGLYIVIRVLYNVGQLVALGSPQHVLNQILGLIQCSLNFIGINMIKLSFYFVTIYLYHSIENEYSIE